MFATWFKRYWCVVFIVLVLVFVSGFIDAQYVPGHSQITSYDGPRTCIRCHQDEAMEMLGTSHYQWTGETPHVTNISGQAGKGDTGFNTYCGSVITSRRIACWSCHAGNGKTPTNELTLGQVNNIDCLVCHSESYKRKAVPPHMVADLNRDRYVDMSDFSMLSMEWLNSDCDAFTGCSYADLAADSQVNIADLGLFAADWLGCTDVAAGCDYQWTESLTYTDYLGVTRTWILPIENENGDFAYGPDEDAMAVGIVEAAQGVHLPTRGTCLSCHAYAAGSDCGKRGDLGTGSVSPPYNVDVHMSPAGEDFACQRCHQTVDHMMLGRGLDLRPSERSEKMTCLSGGCHSSRPHDESRLNNHTARVACQTCHIPKFAKLNSTEMAREWGNPYWAQGMFGGQGGYKPEEIRESNVIPSYKWYDGTSNIYAVGQIATQNSNGQYEFGEPNGDVASAGARIYPMKEHLSESALHLASGKIIPHSTSEYFFTGDFSRAVEKGQELSGMTGSWELVPVHTYQTINHGVEPDDNALACGQCHSSMSGGPVRMDLEQLGYTLKGSRSTVCYQCHGSQEAKPFKTIHDIHVKDKKYDCSWCHGFSRPERNLALAR